MSGTDPLDTRGQGLGDDRHLTIFDHRPHLRVPRQGGGRRSRAAEREAVERMLEDMARLRAVRLQQSWRLDIGVEATTQRDDPAPCGSVRGSRVDGCRDRRRQQDRHDRDNAESTHQQRPSYCPAGDRATSLWGAYQRVNTVVDRVSRRRAAKNRPPQSYVVGARATIHASGMASSVRPYPAKSGWITPSASVMGGGCSTVTISSPALSIART